VLAHVERDALERDHPAKASEISSISRMTAPTLLPVVISRGRYQPGLTPLASPRRTL